MTPFILSFKQVIFQETFSRKCLVTKIFTIFDDVSLSTIKTLYLSSFQATCLCYTWGVGRRNGHKASKCNLLTDVW